MWLWLLVKGALVGIVIAVPVGPVGVLCVRRTIVHGRLAGFMSGLGAASADAVFGIIAAGGLTFISQWLLDYQNWLRFIGGAYLIYIGISALRASPEERDNERDPEGLIRDFASTFALTITNPITILAFLAIFASIGLTGKQATWASAGILVGGVWLGSLVWWAGLAFGTGLMRMSLKRHHLIWINRGSGGILVVSGVVLLGTLLVKHFG
ncbi:MAG: LysE family translocator [Alphaproteobacteria bacterium]|nr:LysE family translocator [Alphaproteobacteria bacterium]